MSIKIDLKTGLILLLLLFCIVFFSMWYLKGADSASKRELKRLKTEYKNLQKSRDSLDQVNIMLKDNFNDYQNKIDQRDSKIQSIEYQLSQAKIDLSQSKKDLSNMKTELTKTRKRVEDLKKNPIKREDDDLIESLKEKLK
jgi:chromosome segregation ATPase